jgi:AraC family transcriptional regulator
VWIDINSLNDEMNPRIERLSAKKLVGNRMLMTFSNNRSYELWSGFMPRRKEISNHIGTNLYSVQIYAPRFFENFDPVAEFDKWAAIEVTDFNKIPGGLETYTLPEGLYAVFHYQGAASSAAATFKHILGTWLPNSDYILDDRPHFEILGEKYKNEDPGSEEELWIPIKHKSDATT